MTQELISIDHRRQVETRLASLRSDTTICQENRDLIRTFARDCYADGLSHARVAKYLTLLKQIARKLDKPFKEVQKDDLKIFLQEIELSHLSAWSKGDYRVTLRKFYRWLSGGKTDPPLVDWIKTTVPRSKRKLPTDLLTEEDIAKLIDAADHPRDRALIAVLWETGCRASELLLLRIRNFKNDGEVCFLDLNGKTGPRRVPIVWCVPHVNHWLSFHPSSKDPQSPLWTLIGSSHKHYNLQYAPLLHLLKKLTINAGLSKRVHPHLFRHSRATFLASRLTEAQMKHFFGWTQGSDMAAIYVHLSGRDIQDSILQLYGKTSRKDRVESKIIAANSHRCGSENAGESGFHGICGGQAAGHAVASVSSQLKAYDQLISILLADKRVVNALNRRLSKDSGLTNTLKGLVKTLEIR